MDDNAKKKLVTVKKLIQEKKFQEALEDLQVMAYKYSKVFQIYLMMGLCYEKSGKDLDAQKAYLEVLDLNPNDSQALKQLCEIYTKRGDNQKGTKYLELMADIVKKGDPKKYREVVVKLIDLYEKDLNMEKIDALFQQYSKEQNTIGEDFVHIAKAYFKIGTTNQCFFLQKFQIMGMKGQELRPIQAAAKEEMNRLLIQIVNYLKAVALAYQLTRKDIANSIMQLKLYFPECCSLLMLLLFDQYCVGQMSYSSYILGEIYYLCQGYFDQTNNFYHNIRYTSPETFSVCMLLAKEYLCFFKEFFTLETVFDAYYPRLMEIQDQLQGVTVRDQYKKKIDKFILKQCRELAQQAKHQNIQSKLQAMKVRIQALENSYLEQVIARIALHSFKNYDQLSDMKYKLKVRIRQLQEGQIVPHLYKYYYDYVIKMARIFKSLDEEIPLRDVLGYITTHDPKDFKYKLEQIWFQFGMEAKQIENERKGEVADKAIREIRQIYEQLELPLQSVALRRIVALKVFKGDRELKDDIQGLLKLERSFENLQVAAFYHYFSGLHKQALVLVREAYRLNQNSYHTNRLFFLALFKCGQMKEAYAFLDFIRPTFNSVFWVNYFLAINKVNQRRFLQSEALMVKSLQAFQAGSQDNFRFYYEKVWDMGSFSLMYMIKQNEYYIFYEELILPQEFVYGEVQALSNLYFERNVQTNRMRLFHKEGELLKILGRTKSSLNYLEDAYNESLKIQIAIDSDPKVLFDHALIRKEYATLLFYSCQMREAEEMLVSAHTIVQWMLAVDRWALGVKLSDQVLALFFQISISRLSTLIKFQTQERITEYLNMFKKHIRMPEKTSLTFLKNKYQFHILEFMHERGQIDRVESSVKDFVSYFGLVFEERTSQGFAVRLQELSQNDRKFVRECLEDYYIVRGLSKNAQQQQLLQMLTLFPRSSTLCVLFGSITADVKLQTASYLKVIQLDKQSTISMDILASLYLKQKNYLAASKLFLKSLQTDILNPKCYLGLAICLFCLIVRAVEQGYPKQLQIVQQSLVRINSYMQFIRLNDPFENYHLLSFLKVLLSNNPETLFQNKIVMQSAYKNCLRYRDSLLGQLIEEASGYWKKLNIWKSNDQVTIFQNYVEQAAKNGIKEHGNTVRGLLKRADTVAEELGRVVGEVGKEIVLKKYEKLLHEIGISINLALKEAKYDVSLFELMLSACLSWQTSYEKWSFTPDLIFELKKQIKSYLYEYALLDKWSPQIIIKIDALFRDILVYNHFITHNKKIPKLQSQISRRLMLNPANQQIRRIHQGYQILRKGINLRRPKLSYRLDLHNTNNLTNADDERTYKQLMLLYRDPQAILMYLSKLWADCGARCEQNVKKWVKMVDHLLVKREVKEDERVYEKGRRIRLEMLAFLEVKYSSKVEVFLDEGDKSKLAKFVCTFRIISLLQTSQDLKAQMNNLSQLFKGPADDLDWWILLTLVSYISRRVKSTPQFQTFLHKIQQLSTQPRISAFIKLTRFIQTSTRTVQTEDQLVNQIVDLTQLAQSCIGVTSPPTEVIVECTRGYLGGSSQDVEAELARAAQSIRMSSYSDQILINFFQVLIQYKNAQNNPNGQGVIQYFTYMADNMLMILREPLLKGFVLSLKGMIESLSEGQGRSIRHALMLAPAAARNLVQSK